MNIGIAHIFLAWHKGLSFISELSSLTSLKLLPNTLEEKDELRWVKEAQNSFDENAIKVYKGDIFVEYIKKVHSKVFYKKMLRG